MSRWVRAGLCACALLGFVFTVAAVAYQGTQAGKKLAGQLLGSYKHVHYLQGSAQGSVYYCPSWTAGYVEAPQPPPPPCSHTKATASWVNTLKNGKGAGALGTVTAKGKPTITFVAQKSATYIKASGARCWTRQPVTDGSFVGNPPFGFFPKEYMTVGSTEHGNVQLNGKMGSHFKETDTLNAKTHQMVGESIYFNLGEKNQMHLQTSYKTVSKAPKVPATNPVC